MQKAAFETLRDLHAITSDAHLSLDAKIDQILRLGVQTFALPLALVSRIRGDDYEVRYAFTPDDAVKPGQHFELGKTYCVHTLNANAPTSFSHAGESEISSHPCYQSFGLESYIGSPIMVDDKRFGTLNFSSPDPRDEAFSAYDHEIIQLFAQWIGNEIGRERARRALQKAKDQAEQAVRVKDEFLANMSHEIRTPMNGVLGLLETLSHSDLDKGQQEQVAVARDSGKALLSLINDILDLSKVEAGKLELEESAFDLPELLESIHASLLPLAEQKGLSLELKLSDMAERHCCGDPNRIRQILVNIVGNALKFTESGSVRIEACMKPGVNPDDGSVRLVCEIRDTGIGIDMDKLDELFNAFTQVDPSTTRRFGGTGLGLAIVKQLCHLMGGRVHAESEPGKGTCFTVTLPLRAAESEELGEVRESGKQFETVNLETGNDRSEAINDEKVAACSSSCEVLLVEDNKVNQLVAIELLKLHGVSADVAEDGQDALGKLSERDRRKPYRLILMDCQMPVMDGYDASLAIRKGRGGRSHQGVPIVALTANAMDGDRERCFDAGMNDYLTKPLEADQIGKIVKQYLSLGS